MSRLEMRLELADYCFSDYFQGGSAFFTEFDEVIVGAGLTLTEAIEDAKAQFFEAILDWTKEDAAALEQAATDFIGKNESLSIEEEDCEGLQDCENKYYFINWYFTIN